MDELIKYFENLRFSPDHHLGLGDIRLTIAQQEEIINIMNNENLILKRISELRNEYFIVLEEWKKEKTFKRLDRLKEIEQIFKELKIKL